MVWGWIAGEGRLLGLGGEGDPIVVVDRTAPARVPALRVLGDELWLLDGAAPAVQRRSAHDGVLLETFVVASGARDLVVDDAAVWVHHVIDGTPLTRIDRRSGEVERVHRAGVLVASTGVGLWLLESRRFDGTTLVLWPSAGGVSHDVVDGENLGFTIAGADRAWVHDPNGVVRVFDSQGALLAEAPLVLPGFVSMCDLPGGGVLGLGLRADGPSQLMRFDQKAAVVEHRSVPDCRAVAAAGGRALLVEGRRDRPGTSAALVHIDAVTLEERGRVQRELHWPAVALLAAASFEGVASVGS